MDSEDRRDFLKSAFFTSITVGIPLLGLAQKKLDSTVHLRPPGALDENDLLASCIKCGQCVQVCPVDAIKSGSLLDGFGVGVPYIDPRKQACDFSCDVGQCILACPTGSLTYHKPSFLKVRPGAELPAAPVLLAKKKDPDPILNFRERLGLAQLARPEQCLARRGEGLKGSARPASFKGKKRFVDVDRWKPIPLVNYSYNLELCDLCARECPIEGAIHMEKLDPSANDEKGLRMEPRVTESCVGCGVCEMVCPAEPAAIVVKARAVISKDNSIPGGSL